MKTFLMLLGVVVAGLVGYSVEPDLRLQLTGETPVKGKAKPDRVAVVPLAPVPAIDPASFPADQLPDKVLLKADAEIADASSEMKVKITAGSRVNLIRLDGENVVISPGAGPLEGSVPVSQTDLLEQLAALPKNPVPAEPELAVTTPAEPEMPAAITPAPAPEPAPQPEPTPEPEPAPQPEPAPDPTPTPEPTTPTPTGPVDVLAVMQASIKGGEIKEFTFDQVLDWQVSEETETIDGEVYNSGIASYKAETVFGVKTIQAKALVKDGKVVRWLWPKSGMEIK